MNRATPVLPPSARPAMPTALNGAMGTVVGTALRAALGAALLGGLPLASPVEAQVAMRGGTVQAVSGKALSDGVVLIGTDGRFAQVGPAASVTIPPGITVLEAAVVTPGLVDAQSVMGLSGVLGSELPSDQDHIESPSPSPAAMNPTSPRPGYAE